MAPAKMAAERTLDGVTSKFLKMDFMFVFPGQATRWIIASTLGCSYRLAICEAILWRFHGRLALRPAAAPFGNPARVTALAQLRAAIVGQASAPSCTDCDKQPSGGTWRRSAQNLQVLRCTTHGARSSPPFDISCRVNRWSALIGWDDSSSIRPDAATAAGPTYRRTFLCSRASSRRSQTMSDNFTIVVQHSR
jgi:hypothetical protein